MSPSVEVWFELSACASILAVAGFRLSRYGDIIADKSGLSGSWIGLVLLASVTSLPELVTGVSSIVAAQAPNIAVGDVLGSCVFNLAILVVVDILHRPESVYRRTSQGHILSAAFGIVLTGLAGLGILLAGRPVAMAIAHVGAYTPVFLIVYFVAVRSIFDYEREQLREHVADEASRYPDITLRQAAAQYAVAAAAVLAAGIWLPFVGVRLAEAMGWHKSFVGTLFVAGATSLPELVVTLAALRIGAIDMAISNLLGSNLFNIAILAVDDVLFTRGPLLSFVAPVHALTAASASIMTGIVVIGLLYRPRARFFLLFGWVSLGLLAVYLLNTYLLFLHGE